MGTVLVDRVVDVARGQGCSRLWLVTTNDNVDALRFYQRCGFRLSAVRCGAVEAHAVPADPGGRQLRHTAAG